MTTLANNRFSLVGNHRDTETQCGRLLPFVALCFCVFTLAGLAPATSLAGAADDLQRQGVTAYQQGDYQEALELFNQAAEVAPDSPTALYNQGTALYKLGRYEEAATRFAASSTSQTRARPRARAAYNQGRALLAAAAAAPAPEKKEKLLASQHAFQQALRDDPQLTAARRGIEELRQALAALNQQHQGQSQPRNDPDANQQGEQHKGQDMQKQLQEAANQQQEMASQSQAAGSAANSQAPDQEQLQEMAKQQQSVRQSLEEIKEKLRQEAGQEGGGSRTTQQMTEELGKAINDQKEAEESLKEGKLDQARQQQEQAADRLSQLSARPGDHDPKNGEPSGPDAVPAHNGADAGQEQGAPTARRSDSTVDDILVNEEALHEMRRLRMQRQQPAGGKDW